MPVARILHSAFLDEKSRVYHIFHDVLSVIILVSIVAVILESVDSLAVRYAQLFFWAEVVFISIFLCEYIIRLCVTPKPLAYAVSPMGIIDLIAIVPGLIVLGYPLAQEYLSLRVLRILRILRLLRLFRVLKLISYAQRRWNGNTMWDNLQWQNIQIYVFSVFSLVVISGTLIYLAELRAVDPVFKNIPEALWWSVVTVSTVGYGDFVPATPLGKVIAALTMLSGLALFAMLVSVMGKSLQRTIFGSTLEETELLGGGVQSAPKRKVRSYQRSASK